MISYSKGEERTFVTVGEEGKVNSGKPKSRDKEGGISDYLKD